MLASLVKTLGVLNKDISVVQKVAETVSKERDGLAKVAKSAQSRALLKNVLEIVLQRERHVNRDILWGGGIDAKHGLLRRSRLPFVVVFSVPQALW